MWTILNKEFKNFFSSATGYLVVGIFLITSGLFLWILPGQYNILDNGYSSLDGFFTLAPWLFLFLVPGITMRMFAEEKRMGTIELLFTYPLPKYKLVLGKYFAAVLLGVCSLLPTLVYFYSVYHLGETVGNLDVGATSGSYIGLLLIFSTFTALGIFSSTLSNNPLVSFIVSATLCFFFYYGFDLLASLFGNGTIQTKIIYFSIHEHYDSISRGVIDSRDLVFFTLVSTLFIVLSVGVLSRKSPFAKKTFLKYGVLLLLSLTGLCWVSSYFSTRIDLTLEKRYTLANPTKKLLKQLDKTLTVNVYLAGDLNASFQKLQEATKDLLKEFNYYYNGEIAVHFINPNQLISAKDGKSLAKVLEEKGVAGVEVNERTPNGAHIQKIVYPWVSILYNNQERKVNILNNDLGKSGYENINTSIRNLEYNLTDVLRTLSKKKEEAVAFLEGHGEFKELEVEDISKALSEYYRIDRGSITNQVGMLDNYQAIIIAGSHLPFSETDKYILDQYLMQGGKILWMMDGCSINMDSLSLKPTTFFFPNETNLRDQLFHYGVRINSDLIEDAQCVNVAMNTSKPNEKPQYEPMPWYFSPLLFPSQQQVIGKNVGPVKGEFVSSLSLVGNNPAIQKTILITSSSASRKHLAPSMIDLRMASKGVDSSYFNEANLPVAALLEGKFTSAFVNRVLPSNLQTPGAPLKESKPTKMIVISDADIIRNGVQEKNGSYEALPLGYDQYLNQNFNNKKFILNAINYLCDDEGWMQLRSREISLRLLSKKKCIHERFYWQILNLSIPLLLLLLGGVLFGLFRRKF